MSDKLRYVVQVVLGDHCHKDNGTYVVAIPREALHGASVEVQATFDLPSGPAFYYPFARPTSHPWRKP